MMTTQMIITGFVFKTEVPSTQSQPQHTTDTAATHYSDKIAALHYSDEIEGISAVMRVTRYSVQ